MIKSLIIITLLSSCNFKPIYSNSIQHKNLLLNNISFDYNYTEFNLEQKIIVRNLTSMLDKFNAHDKPSKYKLEINKVQEKISPITIAKDGDISEYNYKVAINVSLSEDKGTVFIKDFTNSINFYTDNGYYASQIAIKKFREDLTKTISHDLETELQLNMSSAD